MDRVYVPDEDELDYEVVSTEAVTWTPPPDATRTIGSAENDGAAKAAED